MAADISPKPRTFVVWLDKNLPNVDATEVRVDVPAGEDAEEICSAALESMIENELDTGWRDVSEDDEG